MKHLVQWLGSLLSAALVVLFMVFCSSVMVSCNSLMGSYNSFSWIRGTDWSVLRSEKERNTSKLSVFIKTPRVDKPVGAVSVQEELERLIPLILLQEGAIPAAREDSGDLQLELLAVEREFIQGWQNQRSVTVEAWVWPGRTSHGSPLEGSGNQHPVAIGRATAVGQRSLASSRDLEVLVRTAVRRALRGVQRGPEQEAL